MAESGRDAFTRVHEIDKDFFSWRAGFRIGIHVEMNRVSSLPTLSGGDIRNVNIIGLVVGSDIVLGPEFIIYSVVVEIIIPVGVLGDGR